MRAQKNYLFEDTCTEKVERLDLKKQGFQVLFIKFKSQQISFLIVSYMNISILLFFWGKARRHISILLKIIFFFQYQYRWHVIVVCQFMTSKICYMNLYFSNIIDLFIIRVRLWYFAICRWFRVLNSYLCFQNSNSRYELFNMIFKWKYLLMNIYFFNFITIFW